jgi:protein transport protein SEC23
VKSWTCPFSGTRNNFPPKYADHISERPPPEMLYPTVDYILPLQISGHISPPSFVFLIDTCLYQEELETLKDTLQQVK